MALVNGIATGLEERVAMDRWLLLFDNAREKGRVGSGKFAPKVTWGWGRAGTLPARAGGTLRLHLKGTSLIWSSHVSQNRRDVGDPRLSCVEMSAEEDVPA